MSDARTSLRLQAREPDDLEIVSAMLQDAVIAVRDMAFLPAERRFVMVANRFRWEDAARANAPPGEPPFSNG